MHSAAMRQYYLHLGVNIDTQLPPGVLDELVATREEIMVISIIRTKVFTNKYGHTFLKLNLNQNRLIIWRFK